MITWKKDPFRSEFGEFERVTIEYSPKKQVRENLKYLETEYNRASKVSLVDSDWRKLGNTDSFETNTIQDVYDAIRANNTPRDVERILRQYVSGSISCPIVIKFADGRLQLVAGNTRLMIARVLQIKPKIILVKTDW
jgi:hypothetical protein